MLLTRIQLTFFIFYFVIDLGDSFVGPLPVFTTEHERDNIMDETSEQKTGYASNAAVLLANDLPQTSQKHGKELKIFLHKAIKWNCGLWLSLLR